jgi:RNA polymerase sigma-70 factor (ECF subfamily)
LRERLQEQFEQAREGDASAFACLIRSHQRMVYSIALRMLVDRGAAEDLAQEVFIQLHRSLRDIQSTEHLSAWLRRVTTHRAIDCLRARRASLDEPIEMALDVANEHTAPDPLLRQHLSKLLAELSMQARAVLVLRYQEDLDPLEIARTLDMPINTVKSHLKRSLAMLRERIDTTAFPMKVAE